MALKDAWCLAEQLVNPGHESLADAVAAYDAESMPRSKQALEGGRWVLGALTQQGWKHYLILVMLRIVGLLMSLSAWWQAGPAQSLSKLWSETSRKLHSS